MMKYYDVLEYLGYFLFVLATFVVYVVTHNEDVLSTNHILALILMVLGLLIANFGRQTRRRHKVYQWTQQDREDWK